MIRSHKTHLILPYIVFFVLSVTILAGCGTSTIQPTRTPPVPTTTPSVSPSATLPPTRTAAPTATPAPTNTPLPSPTLVRPEFYSNSPISVQAEWEGNQGKPVFQWSPDGSKLIFNTEDGFTMLDTETMQPVWNGPSGKSVAFSADGNHVAIATGQAIELYDAASGDLEAKLDGATCTETEWVDFRQDGRALVVARVNRETAEAEFSWLAIDTGICSEPFATVPGTPNLEIQYFSVSRDGDYAIAVVENQVFVWSLITGIEILQKPGQAAAFGSGGYYLAVQDKDTATIFVTSSGELLQTFEIPDSRAFDVGGDWSMFAVSTPDGPNQKAYFYDSGTGDLLRILRDLPAETEMLSFSPDNRWLLVIARDVTKNQPSRYFLLGLYSGLPTARINETGEPEIIRPVTTPAPLFPILYPPINGHPEFPTPIATPAGESQDYRLKEWNEDLAIDLMRPLVEFATANYHLGFAASVHSFMWPQDAIRIAAQEYMMRFPNSPYREAVQWRLASSNIILNRHDSDAWILSQIERGLDDGSIDPSDMRINAYLAPFGFSLHNSLSPALTPASFEWFGCDGAVNPVLAPGLSDDTGTTRIIAIGSLWGGNGIIAALHQDTNGQYQIIPIHSRLNFNVSYCQSVLVEDLTGDGRPEVWIDDYWHSGSMDSKDSFIYQWRDGKFVEISGERISGFDFPYEIKLLGSPGQAKTIEFTRRGPYTGSGPTILHWDGEKFAEGVSDTPIKFDFDGRVDPYFVNGALEQGAYQKISRQLHGILDDPEQKSINHPNDTVVLRFGLAISEALQFKPAEARAVLEGLLQSKSTGIEFDYVNAVQEFLEVYQTDADLWQACLLVQDKPFLPCPQTAVFRELVKRVAEQSENDLPKALEEYGIRFAFTTSFHGNDDEKPDWFLLPKFPERDGHTAIAFTLLSNGNGYNFYSLPLYGDTQETPVEFKTIQLPGNSSTYFLFQLGDEFKIFHATSGSNDDNLQTKVYALSVSTYQEIIDEDSYDLVVWHNVDHYRPPELFHWDVNSGQFQTFDYAEYLVFTKEQPDEAVRVIIDALNELYNMPEDSYIKFSERPRLQYLLGLSYELMGDEASAKDVYFDLWRTPTAGIFYGDNPEQPYAIMAREKLEHIQQ